MLGFLPQGRELAQEDWEARHRTIVTLLWLQMVGLVAFGAWRGYSWQHLLVDGGAVTLFAALATQPGGGRRLRASFCSVGLLTGAALGVHLSGGVIEAHFMYFVVIALLMIYQDWIPFLVAIAYVVGEHGLVGLLIPASVYNHASGQKDPWLWAGIHGAFVLAASAANLAYWRLNENDHAKSMLMLHQAARVDGLTGAVNRRGWDEHINQVLNLARRPELSVAVAILDFDDFKDFNDSWGHQRGDQLLQRSVSAWRTALREEDILARFGGDEFSLILPGADLHGAIAVLERVVQLTPEGQTCSVGVATWDGGETSAELIARVDDALYEGKKHKRADERRIYVARSALADGASTPWADRVPRLVDSRGIVAAYQPIVSLADGTVYGYEALARPADEPGCESVAGMFETARRMGYLRDLDWICRRAALEGGARDSMSKPLFINVSATSLLDPLHDVDQFVLLARWAGRSPGQIVLEITEQEDARDLVRLHEVVGSYRDAGFRFGIDGVGQGHSTIELLVATDPDFVKIAGSLSSDAADRTARSAIQAILTFARAQGTTVLAERVETDGQRSLLRGLGIELGQGFLLGRPERQVREAPVGQRARASRGVRKRVPSRRPARGMS